MPRLIDDIRRGGRLGMPIFVAPDKETAWSEYARRSFGLLENPRLPVLVIDNVAEYLYNGTDQEYWSLERDFPNLAPPFPMFWCEHRLVRMIHSKTHGDTDVSGWLPQGGRAGMFFVAVAREDAQGEGIPENARWLLWCDLYVDYHKRDVVADGPHGSTFVAIDAEGRAIGNPWMQAYCAPDDEFSVNMMKNVMTWFNPAFLAISFLHCKNVQMVDHAVDPKLAKRYRERHPGAALTPHKTLIIEPLKAILRSEGRAHEHGLAKAMHICRGHFKDYREGRGLFGKYHQLVWQPSLVRGTKGKAAPAREIEVRV
jgi:hypothetical protein